MFLFTSGVLSVMSEWFVGVDLGATNVRVAVGNRRGDILGKISEATEKRRGPVGITNQVVRMIGSLRSHARADFVDKKICGIGIGSAGPLDLQRGGLVHPPNLPWEYVPLVEPLREAFHVPVQLLNDCTAAVMGEREFGGGKGFDNVVYVTISTGIGGGVYVDGHLLIGKDGNAHEIGHMTIDLEGRLQCGCGKRGHWEAYCSGLNIPNYVRLLLEEEGETAKGSLLMKLTGNSAEKITTQILYETAKVGDELSKRFVERIGELNAIGFANIVNIYDPELIVVGGTVALKNQDLVIEPIGKWIEKYALNRLPEIRLTLLGEDVVLYGALASIYLTSNHFK